MNSNELKMKIKSLPVLSSVAIVFNRTTVRMIKRVVSYPKLQKNNQALLKSIKELDSHQKHKIWYFGVPTHPNLGDQAQKFVILSWLQQNYPESEIVKIPSSCFNGGVRKTIKVMRGIIGSADLIIMQSGHTMDGLHPDETAHRFISEAFPENRIIFFPTSIEFLSRRGMQKDIKSINKHHRTLFLARDPVSADKARKLYPNVDVKLYPDVVTSLIGRYEFDSAKNGILLCTRNDGEKLYSYEKIDRLAQNLSSLSPLDRTDTTVDWQGINLDSEEAWQRIERVIESYSRYKVVVTDRYHGTIFARIAGTPVVVLKTRDHKVTSGAEWFIDANDGAIRIADDLTSVPDLVKELMTKFPEGAVAPAFASPYYDGLHTVIDEM